MQEREYKRTSMAVTGYCIRSHFVQICNPGFVKVLVILGTSGLLLSVVLGTTRFLGRITNV